MELSLLHLVIASSGALHIRADYAKNLEQTYILKPLTTFLIFCLAMLQPDGGDGYKTLVLIGLMFSLGGDVFLMLPRNMFLQGLVSFLCAHVCYIWAFINRGGFYVSFSGLLPFLLIGVCVYSYLWPGLGKMKVPTIVYISAIVTMAWQAFGLFLVAKDAQASEKATLAFVGALLFVVSDSVLAINRFRRKFYEAQFVVMTTYFASQTLIAMSI